MVSGLLQRFNFSRRTLVYLVIAWFALIAGIVVRDWVWNNTDTIHFTRDLNNGDGWGMRVNHDGRANPDAVGAPTWIEFFRGYRDLYDREVESPNPHDMKLDYAPLRLLTMSLWSRWRLTNGRSTDVIVDPPVNDVWPLLWFNTICALASAAGALALVEHWVRKSRGIQARRGPSWRSVTAALLVWFNPAALIDGHAWPQWDIWCVPFFLWGAYAASAGSWLVAGVLILVGALLKGQLLFAAPVLLIWAIFAGGVRPALHLLVGFLSAAAVIACIWLVPTLAAWIWVVCVILGAVGLWMIAPRWRPRSTAFAVALTIAIAIWSAFWLFGGSINWANVAFVMPTETRQRMSIGATNLPQLLAMKWDWSLDDPVFDSVTIRALLRTLYVIALILCGIAAALHARRSSARLLLALVTPWIIFFAILPQIHERHFFWAAVVSAIAVGVSFDWLLLHVLISLLATGDIARRLLQKDPDLAPGISQFLETTTPELAWIVVLVAAIYLYQACKPPKRERAIPHPLL